MEKEKKGESEAEAIVCRCFLRVEIRHIESIECNSRV